MMLVVFGHEARGLRSAGIWSDKSSFDLFDSVIYGFHMPLFFFLSGLFFQRTLDARGRMGAVASRVDTLLYPYVLWSLVQGAIEVALSRYTNGAASIGSVLAFAWRPRAQFWFLYALFVLSVLGALIFHRRRWAALAVALVATTGVYLATAATTDPPIVQDLGRHAVYFVVGVVLANPRRVARFLERSGAKFVAILAFIGLNYWLHVDAGWRYQDGGPWGLIAGLSGIAMVCAISLGVSTLSIRTIETIGEQSMAIYLLHILVIAAIRIMLSRLFGINDLILHITLSCTVGIAIPTAIGWLANRHHLRGVFELPAGFTMNRLRAFGPPRSTSG